MLQDYELIYSSDNNLTNNIYSVDGSNHSPYRPIRLWMQSSHSGFFNIEDVADVLKK